MLKKLICALAALVLCCSAVFAQNQVKGRVVDESGQPIAGVTVMVDGTTNGTMTDLDGRWTGDGRFLSRKVKH